MMSGPKLVRSSPDDRSGGLLDRIAAALSVPVARLHAPPEPRLLHAASRGTRWLLLCDAHGTPVVRRIAADSGIVPDACEPDFLARDAGSPPHAALTGLVDRLLSTHLRAGIIPPPGIRGDARA